MNLDRFINRPVLSTVISIFVVILGVIGTVSLPIEQYPSIAPPTISVQTSYQGADAQTVMNSVIAPLEESINGVENMAYLTSQATNSGMAQITVYFKQGTNADMAAVNVQNRVQQALSLLPSEVVSVGVTTSKQQPSILMFLALTSEKGEYDEKFVSNYADINVVPAIKRIQGVGSAQSFGSKTFSMRVWLDPVKMKEFRLMPSDLVGVLATQNVEAAPGKLGENSNQSFEYVMRYRGRFKTAEEFGDIIISAKQDGKLVRLKDVAKIELGALYYSVNSRTDKYPSIPIMVSQTAGSNANEIVANIKTTLKDLEKDFPPGLKAVVVHDVTSFLYASIEEVLITLLEAFLLVILVVYIFLQDFRSTLIPMIAIPVSLIGTFFFLKMFGFSINLLTLSALVLAIAIVVDDAIVVVEAVHAKLDQGYKSAHTASIDAMHEIGSAIVSITLVMSAVFIPVSFVSGISGTFYRQFGITMAVAIIISALNALTLSPALCAIFLKPHTDKEGKKPSLVDRFHMSFNTAFDTVLGKYSKGVSFFIKHKITSFAIVVLSIVLFAYLMNTTRTGLIPDEDTGTVFATVQTTPGTTLEKTQKIMDDVTDIIYTLPGVNHVMNITGYSFIAGQGSNQGTFVIKLKDFSERDISSEQLIGMVFAKTSVIKDAQIMAFQPPMIPGFSASNGLTFTLQDKSGGDINKFFDVSQKFLMKLNQRPEFAYAMSTFNPSYPQYMISIDVAKCMQSGITPSTVLTTMQGYYGGIYSSNFNSFGKLYRVMVQANPESRMDMNSLNSVYVRTSSGEMAPIKTYITLDKIYGPSNIGRFNLYTGINVNAAAAPGYSSGQAIKALEEVAASELPTGYGYDYSGLTRSENEASDTTVIIFIISLVFVYLILSAQYESYLLPLSVVLSIPFGLAGALLFTNLFHHSNDIYMQISVIMLMGLLAKNAILIIQFALERRQMGMAIKYSAILGAAARLRPILMTSLAMIVGLLPLMFASGVGANGNSTLGASAVGGMLIGMICQIFIVPALFVIFQYLQEKFKPIRFSDMNENELSSELKQFTRPVPKK